MFKLRVVLPLGLLIVAALAVGTPETAAQSTSACGDLPEEPVVSQHLEQDDIASDAVTFDALVDHGSLLFAANFNVCDGQGRPATTGGGDKRDPTGQPAMLRTSAPDSSSCAGCHNQPRSGGGGDFVANVFVLAQTLDPVTESVNGEFSNERNTLGMFGAGPIEMLAREMTAELHAQRDQAIADAASGGIAITVELVAKGVDFGQIVVEPDGTIVTDALQGIDADLIVKPFHQAGAVRSIREFTVNAMNHHHGMQAEERFDLNPDKGADFDEDGIARELTIGDITAASIWQAQLGTPAQVLPDTEAGRVSAERGADTFAQIGCTGCHTPMLELDSALFTEPYGLNPAGTWADTSAVYSFDMTVDGEFPRLDSNGSGGAEVWAYTDLKRHNLCDPEGVDGAIRYYCNESLAQGRPDQGGVSGTEFFLTRKLWDVGNSSPYGHRGDLTTISEATLMHGGEGRDARDAFAALPAADQVDVVTFLKTLQVVPEPLTDAGEATGGTNVNTWLAIVAGVLLVALLIVLWLMLRGRPRGAHAAT
jgi:hypothetical protein